MNKWLRAINPLMKPRAMAEAQWAAQTMVFALALSFIGGIPASVWMAINPGWIIDMVLSQPETGGLSVEEAQAVRPLFDMIMPAGLAVSSLVLIIVYGVLASLQWRNMTRWIPIVWLAFTAYGLLTALARHVTKQAVVIEIGPSWMLIFSYICSAIATVIAISALRGALLLHRLRREP